MSLGTALEVKRKWQWGNIVSRCDGCDAILSIKDVKIDRNSRQNFMPPINS